MSKRSGILFFKSLFCLILFLQLNIGNNSAQDLTFFVDTSEYLTPTVFNKTEAYTHNLMIASSYGYLGEIHRLVKLGADVNGKSELRLTPLIYAVANNKPYAVRALLSYNPNLDELTYLGESALHIACLDNRVEIAELLIRKGANINITDNKDCTPLHYAAIYNYLYITDLLLYYGADTDIKCRDGSTPLTAAIWAGNAEVADLLVQAGANVNISDNKGFTPLHIAAQNGDTLLSRLLLDYGAKIDEINSYNYDVASFAGRNGDMNYTRFLLQSTRWKTQRNSEAILPGEVARNYGKLDYYRGLKEAGIDEPGRISFDLVMVSAGLKACIHDIYSKFSISFEEPLYKVRINIGFDFKPWSTRVLEQSDDDTYYQYTDRRYFPRAGVSKEFMLSENIFRGSTSLVLQFNAGYMFTETYQGTYLKPENKFRINPGIALEKSINKFSFSLGYEYMNTDLYRAGPHWLGLDVTYALEFGSFGAPLKNINWY